MREPTRKVAALLAGLALAALTAGCGGTPNPVLDVRATSVWPLPPEGARIPAPRCVWAGPRDEVLVLDTIGRVLRFDADGTCTARWFMPAVEVGRPEGICRLRDGRIVVADTHYHRLVYFNDAGEVLQTVGEKGTGPGQFIYPVGITQDAAGAIYVAEYGSNDRVQKFSADGVYLLAFGSFGTGPHDFQRPSGLAWFAGEVFVADAINNRIQVFSEKGAFLRTLGSATGTVLHFPYDLSVDGDGTLYVVEYGAGRVTALRRDGTVLGRVGRTGRGRGEFATPWSITIDTQRRLRVADTGNRRIVELVL